MECYFPIIRYFSESAKYPFFKRVFVPKKRKTLSVVDGWGSHTLPFVVCVNFQARGNLITKSNSLLECDRSMII